MWQMEVKMAGVEARGGGAPSLGLSADVTADVDGRHSGGEDIADDECSETGLHRCPRCDYDTLSRLAFVAHVAECSGDNMGEGSVGDNGDGSPDRLNRKMFECDVCNMKFSNGANMRRHKMRHTGVKPYECRVCQKRFFRKDHLAEHFTTHTKTLPYHCPICNRGFQRQIAMRAHFQNEHVGQHDMVKSCPLCSYRAGSMKSLRVHFYNRHGIDLDNPGPSMGVDGNANAAVNGGLGATLGSAIAGALSGSEDSTPPMHFLTPHIEISMADPPTAYSPAQSDHANGGSDLNGECPSSPQSADSSCVATTTTSTTTTANPAALLRESPERCLSGSNGSAAINGSPMVSPSISLIPIKQEPSCDVSVGGGSSGSGSGEEAEEEKRCSNGPVNLTTSRGGSVGSGELPPAHGGNNLTSLIKVSPLKSLLRDDAKRSRQIPPRPRPELLSAAPGTHSSINGPPPDPAGLTSNPASWRSPPKLQCAFCGIAFPDQTLYFLHKGCHSDTNPWKCNICGEQCCSVYDFNAHLLSKSHQ